MNTPQTQLSHFITEEKKLLPHSSENKLEAVGERVLKMVDSGKTQGMRYPENIPKNSDRTTL